MTERSSSSWPRKRGHGTQREVFDAGRLPTTFEEFHGPPTPLSAGACHALRSKKRANRLKQVSCRKSCRSRFVTGTTHAYIIEHKENPAFECRLKQPASAIRLQQVQSLVRGQGLTYR